MNTEARIVRLWKGSCDIIGLSNAERLVLVEIAYAGCPNVHWGINVVLASCRGSIARMYSHIRTHAGFRRWRWQCDV